MGSYRGHLQGCDGQVVHGIPSAISLTANSFEARRKAADSNLNTVPLKTQTISRSLATTRGALKGPR